MTNFHSNSNQRRELLIDLFLTRLKPGTLPTVTSNSIVTTFYCGFLLFSMLRISSISMTGIRRKPFHSKSPSRDNIRLSSLENAFIYLRNLFQSQKSWKSRISSWNFTNSLLASQSAVSAEVSASKFFGVFDVLSNLLKTNSSKWTSLRILALINSNCWSYMTFDTAENEMDA